MNLQEVLKNFESKAKEIFNDNEKLRELIESVRKEIENNDKLKDIVGELRLFVDMTKDYINGEYKEISERTIILVVAALLYLISPIDILPDFLLGGYLDDLIVIYLVLKLIKEEVDLYRDWKKEKHNVVYEIKENVDSSNDNEVFEIVDIDE